MVGVSGERFEVGPISGEDGAAGLGERNDERIDGRPCASEPPKLRCASRHPLADLGFNDARPEEPVCVGVAPRVALERLDEHHRRHDRRPQFVLHEGADERRRRLRARR